MFLLKIPVLIKTGALTNELLELDECTRGMLVCAAQRSGSRSFTSRCPAGMGTQALL